MGSVLRELTPDELQTLLDNSDSYSDLLRKIGLCPKGGNPDTLKEIIKEYSLDETKLNENRKQLYKRCANKAHEVRRVATEDILSGNKYPNYDSQRLLERLIKDGYKTYKCEMCGITEWNGKPIKLHLHHLDGNHSNNSILNLQIICPNCHSQTDNYGGKNVDKEKHQKRLNETKQAIHKMQKLPPMSREELKDRIRIIPFSTIGKEFGVSATTIRRWCDKYRLPRKVSVIRKYSDEEWSNI